jgi:hypothetical protein
LFATGRTVSNAYGERNKLTSSGLRMAKTAQFFAQLVMEKNAMKLRHVRQRPQLSGHFRHLQGYVIRAAAFFGKFDQSAAGCHRRF